MAAPDPFAPAPTAALVLADGTVFYGRGLGATGRAVGEVCFNTSMTGYQEILTDPSYAGQLITFTFPHIGNVGTNDEDVETGSPASRGAILRCDITDPANWRNVRHLDAWLKRHDLVAIAGVDTRRLTRRIRDLGAPHGALAHAPDGSLDADALAAQAAGWPGLEGMDLAHEVSCRQPYRWEQTLWSLAGGYGRRTGPAKRRLVALDFGAKHNILRHLAGRDSDVTVVPAAAGVDEVLRQEPDGLFLSNGPGDPAATGAYAVPVVRELVNRGLPTFGICLGHQILALALGAETQKMQRGHRGANHPVQDTTTGKVEITCQNHGFVVLEDSLPGNLEITHRSLFDGSNEGLRDRERPIFSVQYHPEASPGPQDSSYLFDRFIDLVDRYGR